MQSESDNSQTTAHFPRSLRVGEFWFKLAWHSKTGLFRYAYAYTPGSRVRRGRAGKMVSLATWSPFDG